MLKYKPKQGAPFSIKEDSLITYLKALAEPNRLRIFDLLMEGVYCNCELGEKLEMPPNLISHHLAILRQAGLIKAKRDTIDARWIYYSVNRAALEQLNIALRAFLDPDRVQQRQPICSPHLDPKLLTKHPDSE
ncbi:MAG: metalloregulator ArsR/SmtB family transcription factor [Anaerolineales bacterium]|nr:metalloregulator ArsR/SmtB family transcription factor [Anaerolineales bacterium]